MSIFSFSFLANLNIVCNATDAVQVCTDADSILDFVKISECMFGRDSHQ